MDGNIIFRVQMGRKVGMIEMDHHQKHDRSYNIYKKPSLRHALLHFAHLLREDIVTFILSTTQQPCSAYIYPFCEY